MKLPLRNAQGKPRWTLFFSIALAAVLLVLAFRGVDWGEMLRTVQRGRAEYLFLAFWTLCAAYLLRSLRWRVLLSAEKPIHPVIMYWATLIGYLGNAFLPARAGELIRSVALGARANISKSYVLATALIERVIDVLVLVLFSVLAIPALTGVPEWLISAARVMAVLGSVAIVGLFIASRLEGPIGAFMRRLPLPIRFRGMLERLVVQFLLGMRALQHPGRALSFGLLTIVIWMVDVSYGVLIAQAFGLTLSFPQALLLLAALGLSSAAPSTPGYVGIFQFVAVTLLPPFGFTQNEALVYILAYQAVTYVAVIIWGGIGLWRLGVGTLTTAELPPDPVESGVPQAPRLKEEGLG